MPPMHLRHGRRYCLGYCSDMRTEAAGNVAPPSLYCRHACELDVDSEQSLIFLCKVTARETQAREWRIKPRETRASRFNPLLL